LSVDANCYPFVVVGKRLPFTDSTPPTPEEESVELALLFSAVSAAPYATMPKSAIAIPKTFLKLIGSPSAKNPNAKTKTVFKCPKTWYVTASHLPITRNVEKFTSTAMTQVKYATNTIAVVVEPPSREKTFSADPEDDALVKPTSRGNAIAHNIAAMYGEAA
jgi:hypothetical protein